jgi:hypothetical protein
MMRYAILVVVYLLLILILPGNQAFMRAHNVTIGEYRTLQFLVALPLIAIWFVGFYGYAKLEEYTRSIKKTPEAMGFKRLTQGCLWIAWSLPVYAVVNLISESITSANPSTLPTQTIVINYIDLLFPLIGFTLIGMASRHFFERSKITLTAGDIRGITLLFVLGGVLYCYFIFRQFSDSGLSSTNNPFYLPVWLIVITFVVPYLYAWFVGMLAIYELLVYCRKIRGVLYRQALHLLVVGLFVMILGSVALQYSRSTQFGDHNHLFLGTYLAFNLVFQIISGTGFILIALGAIRLKKIEEV